MFLAALCKANSVTNIVTMLLAFPKRFAIAHCFVSQALTICRFLRIDHHLRRFLTCILQFFVLVCERNAILFVIGR